MKWGISDSKSKIRSTKIVEGERCYIKIRERNGSRIGIDIGELGIPVYGFLLVLLELMKMGTRNREFLSTEDSPERAPRGRRSKSMKIQVRSETEETRSHVYDVLLVFTCV